MNIALKVSDIWKEYDGSPVLKGCSFSFERSGIYVLMGPNGSGKSTFLRLGALLEDSDRGEINFFSGQKMLKKDIALRRKITLVLPRVGVFNTTVYRNVLYGLEIRGIKGAEKDAKVNRVLEFAGLINKKNQNALTLSSGETKRLGIARAMVIEPDILFLDEPTAYVDQLNTEIIEHIISSIKKKNDSTVIIASHDSAQAERLEGRVLMMQDGKIIEK